MSIPLEKSSLINEGFYNFINEEVLPLSSLNPNTFWEDLDKLVSDLTPINKQLLATRKEMQKQIDEWHQQHQSQLFDQDSYQSFLRDIGYLTEDCEDFSITTQNVDQEIATVAGPQLVVPVQNARFALNAANARWGSLYDALYGSDVIPQTEGLRQCAKYNQARGNHVIAYAKDFLDDAFPLSRGSHHDVTSYMVYYQHLLASFADGSTSGLDKPCQFVALSGHKSDPTSVVLVNNKLHIEIKIDRNGPIGNKELAGIDDIQIESALSTIIDFEDSVAAVDSEDKIQAYRNWLGLMQGNLHVTFEKDGEFIDRKMHKDRMFTLKDGGDYRLHGRALLMARNVGHLMDTDLMQDPQGNLVPEGIIDAVVTALIGSIDITQEHNQSIEHIGNSRTGSIYIVKPKMHGPEEVAFTCTLFSAVETMLKLAPNTIKLGIMDEERRTTVNLKQCIHIAKDRIVFINTGFLDRTGDEIHTSMQAGPFLPKARLKNQIWLAAYENWNVDIGLKCGFQGKAQIGKGMWAMPDEMGRMMEEKVNHPLSGANTAWVPSPSAATLHALHYHEVDVHAVQNELKHRTPAKLDSILSIPLMDTCEDLPLSDIERELENNIQGILGYVVRWVEMGIGCSKVPDINNIGLMEDRATLRISSQHIGNWLLHGVCNEFQVSGILLRMAETVDQQNKGEKGYRPMLPDTEHSLAFQTAKKLIFAATLQPNGYTEPLLHHYRLLAKNRSKH